MLNVSAEVLLGSLHLNWHDWPYDLTVTGLVPQGTDNLTSFVKDVGIHFGNKKVFKKKTVLCSDNFHMIYYFYWTCEMKQIRVFIFNTSLLVQISRVNQRKNSM